MNRLKWRDLIPLWPHHVSKSRPLPQQISILDMAVHFIFVLCTSWLEVNRSININGNRLVECSGKDNLFTFEVILTNEVMKFVLLYSGGKEKWSFVFDCYIQMSSLYIRCCSCNKIEANKNSKRFFFPQSIWSFSRSNKLAESRLMFPWIGILPITCSRQNR